MRERRFSSGRGTSQWTTPPTDFQSRADRRRATYSVRRYTDLDQIKSDEYAYWQGQPAHARLAAGTEVTMEAYAMKGIHVFRLQRSLVRSQRP